MAALMMGGLALAGPPPVAPAAGTPPPTGQGQSRNGGPAPGEGAPNDDFIEFLGADDVGDAAWWEFLNKSAPRKAKPPAPPPSQDSKS